MTLALARRPYDEDLKAEIEKQRRCKRNHVPEPFTSWQELEQRLRATGQF